MPSVVDFAGAVRAEQSDDLARCDGERELREGDPLAVALGKPIDRDRWCQRRSSSMG